MNRRIASLLILTVMTSCYSGAQQAEPKKNPPTVAGAPIPERMLSAKNVYLIVATHKNEMNYKNAYKFLAAWDRWKIVEDPKDADLILRITDGIEGSVGVGSGSATAFGGFATGNSMMLGIPLHHFFLAVLDSDGKQLWGTDTNERMSQSANTGRMLKQLKERLTQVEREKAAQSPR